MNARRAARELALLAFSQLSKNSEKLKDQNIEDIVIISVRTLVNNAENELKTSASSLLQIREFIENYEIDHPENASRPIDASIIPVPIPLTSDILGRIDSLIDVADKTFSALEVAEVSSLANKAEVKDYISQIMYTYDKNRQQIDDQISKFSKGWNIGRLVRIDRDILRIAITELLFINDTPISVAIDEAVELAKKYSTEDSSSFINGILRQVVENNNLYQTKK